MKRKIRKAKLQMASKKLAAAGSFQLPAVKGASPVAGGDSSSSIASGAGGGGGGGSMLGLASASGVSSLAGESFVLPKGKEGKEGKQLAGESFKVSDE